MRWENRAHFFVVSAQLMRRILVDFARSRRYEKRGGGAVAIQLDEAALVSGETSMDLVALNEALLSLAKLDDRQSRVVEFSFVPAVSPDGKSIAYIHRVGLNDPFKVAIVPFGGGQPGKEFNLIPGANPFLPIRQMRWSPDGRALHIIISRGGVDNIWTQPIDGGQPVQLTSFKTDRIFSFDWSSDGKQLFLARGNVTPDAVLISNAK